MATELTQQRARELFDYDPSTGVFTHRTAGKGHAVGSHAGARQSRGYVMISARGTQVLAHRLAFLWTTGEMPSCQVDHINGVKTDNRWENLRAVDGFVNQQNRRGANSNNKIGVLGVCRVKRKSGPAFKAEITAGNKKVHLGTFSSVEAASAAYRAAKAAMHKPAGGHWHDSKPQA